MDLAKYRTLFIEESTEHLAEMGAALLELEKDAADADAIDRVFRLAHSVKGMAASLDYTSITEISHLLEDRMERIRSAGRVEGGELTLLFRGLEGLEAMIAAVRENGEPPPHDPVLAGVLSSLFASPAKGSPAAVNPSPASPVHAAGAPTQKKVLTT